MSRANDPAYLDRCFARLVAAALAGKRISVEIYALNYRRVVILEGEHAGKATAAAPSNHKPWKVIGRSTVINGKVQTNKRERPQPSAPRILSNAEIQALK